MPASWIRNDTKHDFNGAEWVAKKYEMITKLRDDVHWWWQADVADDDAHDESPGALSIML